MSTVNRNRFFTRVARIYEAWNSQNEEVLSKVDSMVFVFGISDEDIMYTKTSALHNWIFGAHLADSILVFTKTGLHVLATTRKLAFIEPVKGGDEKSSVPPVSFIVREKSDKDRANFDKVREVIKEAGPNVGYFAKFKGSSDFSKDAVSIVHEGLNLVDVSTAFGNILAIKAPDEIDFIRRASRASVNAWKVFKTKVISAIDLDKKTKMSKFADEFEKEMLDTKHQGELATFVECCYTPIVLSGGNYTLKFSAVSPDTPINYGCIVGLMGCRYRSYCSNVSRTLFIEPNPEILPYYETMLVFEQEVINNLKPGRTLAEVHESSVAWLKKNHPEVADKLYPAPLGFGTGLEFRDSQFLINSKCTSVVKPNMVFVVAVGITKLKLNCKRKDASKDGAIFVSDTILINEEGPNEILTSGAKNKVRSFVVRLQDEGRRPMREIFDEGRQKRSIILDEQTRHKQTNEEKRKNKQKEIGERLNQEAMKRLTGKSTSDTVAPVKKSNISYKSREKLPNEREVSNLMLYVDKRNDTVIVPIYGIPVPFHISMIKNISMSIEGDYTYLRINLAHPGSAIGRDTQTFPDPNAHFIKELSFRATNIKEPGEYHTASDNLNFAHGYIKELQKKYRAQEAEEREKEGAVKQDKLRLNPPTARLAPRLKDLYVRPNIIGKRLTGTLEAHVNGFRYHTLRGDDVDVLYNNIKHAFFQPCDNEMIVLLHFHLRHPVMFGKKKYTDVQFYTEVGEITTDLGKYHHMQDRDDIQSEQQERDMRRKLNSAFQNFCDKTARQTSDTVDFDQPFNQLSFTGVPYRSSCTLKPTSSCLVNLTEWPPLIITLEEVELVYFERVSFQIRNFDMVFIFKDYSRSVQMISSIAAASLDSIKDWLNSCEIRYFEGIQSLNWKNIMRTIVKDPKDFFDQGGWNFLSTNPDEEELEAESDSEAYTPSGTEESGEEEDDESEASDEISEESEAPEEEDEEDGSVIGSTDDEDEEEESEDDRRKRSKVGSSSKDAMRRPMKPTNSGDIRKRPGDHRFGKSSSGPPPKRHK